VIPNQRDPDELQIIRKLRKDVADLKGTGISRWGRLPQLTADPAAPADGTAWIRSDLHELRMRSGGVTSYAGANGPGAPAGTGANGEWYTDTTAQRVYRSDGVGWIIMAEPEQTYAVTVANFTKGASTYSSTFHRSDGYCDFTISIGFGLGFAVGAGPTVSVPIAPGGVIGGLHGAAQFNFFNAAGINQGFINGNSTTVLGLVYLSALNGNTSQLGAAAPAAWAVGNAWWIRGRYQMTTPYS
jgi:hypothetical protein